ncbi:unsaturated chondroitin disaccharide hydrolase [Paenibacillus sp. UNCCL117]|uniref:glycoside hydrolase family 88 protein n=1 Tax=unclassified Paenibacillus TaxID=185978 RepID=UPI00088C0CDE|nr:MULTISPECIES: glycoside hydrolase family 88 protein [unclassified Paenibacillus]SDD56045.1 unsaturated chondroitin disaccharide hydrolase [Paenibacillus sp. cl123]SFW51465.1 unsaturated chondroitin disaccharide hydrolase [Paenibacillus sp. UNCCL117]
MKEALHAHQEFILHTWDRIAAKLSVTSDRIQDGMPYTTKNGVYDDCQDDAGWWTNTFWTGILWQMYRETKEEKYKEYARSIELKMDQVLYGYDELHHDVGFMWLLSSVMNYELTGDDQARRRAMLAANVLSARGNLAGGYIRAWNGDNPGWAIIDCMMNIPLLFWASEQSRDARFKHIGVMHADKTAEHFVREDGSVHHIVVFDEETGEVAEIPRGQGYESGSSWSRGQSWAVYGFAQAYHWTQKTEYLQTAKRIAHYTLSCLALGGYVPACDYRQPADSDLIDSSAGAITACGLIEIAKAVPEAERALYLESAIAILRALSERCAVWDQSDECLLTGGTSAFHSDPASRYTVFNGALIYGDYYFVEAVCKLKALL